MLLVILKTLMIVISRSCLLFVNDRRQVELRILIRYLADSLYSELKF